MIFTGYGNSNSITFRYIQWLSIRYLSGDGEREGELYISDRGDTGLTCSGLHHSVEVHQRDAVVSGPPGQALLGVSEATGQD